MKCLLLIVLLLWTAFGDARQLSETLATCSGVTCQVGEACDISDLCAKECFAHGDCNNPNMLCSSQTTPTTCQTTNCNSDSDCRGPSICHPNNLTCSVIPGACTSNAHCASGEICEIDTGNCLTVCSSSADCGAGKVCGVLGGCVN
jgi:Cys-rich repeat protein